MSAVIVGYRSYAEVDDCLGALAAADPSIEAVVVDHASDAAALEALRARHPGVTFLPTSDNPGFGAGMNRGVARASGALLLLLNPDVRVDPQAPGRLADWLDAHPRSAVVGPRVRTADGRLEASARRFPSWSTVLGGRSTWLSRVWPGNPLTRRNLLVDPARVAPADVDWVSGACMLVRREAFEAVGGFDERFFLYWEDADLCRRLADHGWTVSYEPGAVVTHAGGRSSAHRPVASAVAFHASAFRYFWTHGSPARRLLAPLVGLALAARLAATLALGARARD
jgi:GT2 family glycosyltransferase